jgi:ABC-type transport system substrate-binding protein
MMHKKRTIFLVLILIVIPYIAIGNYHSSLPGTPKTVNLKNSYIDFFTPDISPFFSILLKTFEDQVYPGYADLLKQYLAEIGINLNIILEDWPTFIETLVLYRDFDLTSISYTGRETDIDDLIHATYKNQSSLNIWGYEESMDWNATLGAGLNEWYIDNGTTIMPPDSQERIDHYKEWQQYLMDELLLVLPLFYPNYFSVSWDNLNGYNYSNGNIIRNWGKLSWDGYHIGQMHLDEIIMHGDNWSDLNPCFTEGIWSALIIDACMDKLIERDSDSSFWPHLAESWSFVNDTTIDITLRDDITWMDYGGFTNEYLDVKDLYFSLYCYKNVAHDYDEYIWIEDMEILDDMTLRVYIDDDPVTPENEPTAYCLSALNNYILPEHYLNQTQESDGITPDITHASWLDFEINCWGTGLFEIDTFTEAVETNLTVRSDCWLLDPMVDKSNMDFVNRFGDFTGGLTQLRVRIFDDPVLIKSEFEDGKIDLMESIDVEYLDEYNAKSSFEIQSKPQHNFNFMGYNVRESRGTPMQSRDPCPLLPSMTKGLAIRKAIAYAINQTEMDIEVNDGIFSLHDYPFHRYYEIWFDDDIIKYSRNLTKAKEYMMYAGYDCGLDSDSDGLTDYEELATYNTDRFDSDTDADLMPDGWEVTNGLNPLIDDTTGDLDSDGLSNIDEYYNNTFANDSDTDDDTLLDGYEVLQGLNPLIDDASDDTDSDYLTNLEEYAEGTLPTDADTDKDLLFDGHEVNGIYSPSNPGADISGYVFTDPLLADTDSDGYIDSVELFSDTDPNNSSSFPIVETITVTTTVEGSITLGFSIMALGLVLVISTIISRKFRKKKSLS